MSETVIQAALSRAEIQPPDMQDGLTCAAVLIPLLRVENQWHLMFTRRTDRVETHKGQVAFPGGAYDPTDAHITATALRETHEEIGVPPDEIHLLGNMQSMPTVTAFLVTPVVGIMRWPEPLHLAEHEVSKAFHVPLTWLMDPTNHVERLYTRSNGTSEMVVFYTPYDGETIWGVTGRIVSNFIALISHPV